MTLCHHWDSKSNQKGDKKLSSKKHESILRMKTKSALQNFSWDQILEELQLNTPTSLLTILTNCLPKHKPANSAVIPGVCTSATIMLKLHHYRFVHSQWVDDILSQWLEVVTVSAITMTHTSYTRQFRPRAYREKRACNTQQEHIMGATVRKVGAEITHALNWTREIYIWWTCY